MTTLNIIRAWKDEEYRLSLSEAERAALPENPAGLIDLSQTELDEIDGGLPRRTDICSLVTCDFACLPSQWCQTSQLICW